jgi:hypothetical protein
MYVVYAQPICLFFCTYNALFLVNLACAFPRGPLLIGLLDNNYINFRKLRGKSEEQASAFSYIHQLDHHNKTFFGGMYCFKY